MMVGELGELGELPELWSEDTLVGKLGQGCAILCNAEVRAGESWCVECWSTAPPLNVLLRIQMRRRRKAGQMLEPVWMLAGQF